MAETKYGPLPFDKRAIFLNSIKDENYALYRALQNQDEVEVIKYHDKNAHYFRTHNAGKISLVLQNRGILWWKEEVYTLIYQNSNRKEEDITYDFYDFAPLCSKYPSLGTGKLYYIHTKTDHTYIDSGGKIIKNIIANDGNTYKYFNIEKDGTASETTFTKINKKVQFIKIRKNNVKNMDVDIDTSCIFIGEDNDRYILDNNIFVKMEDPQFFYKSGDFMHIIGTYQDKLCYFHSHDWSNSLNITYLSQSDSKNSKQNFIPKPIDSIQVSSFGSSDDKIVIVEGTYTRIVPYKRVIYLKQDIYNKVWEIVQADQSVKEIKECYRLFGIDENIAFVAGQHVISNKYGHAIVMGFLFDPFVHSYTKNYLIHVGNYDLIVAESSLTVCNNCS